jgi:hypothetical protein
MMLSATAVIAAHLGASLGARAPQSRALSADAMLRAWLALGALLVAAAVLGGGARRWGQLAGHLATLCACVVANTAVHVFSCDSMSYCFLVHAAAGAAAEIAADPRAAHALRVAMVLAAAAVLAAVHLAPFPLPVGSSAFFVHVPEPAPFACYTFEAAHLWAAVLAGGVLAAARAARALAERGG